MDKSHLRYGQKTNQNKAPAKKNPRSRRSFLMQTSMSFSAFSMAHLLQAEAFAEVHSSHKAVINIHLDGGAPQMDTIDPKPNAPVEIRGDFDPIATAIPGVHFTELMPQMARMSGSALNFTA